MHREVRDNLENILAGAGARSGRHLDECGECSAEVAAMREQGKLLQGWRGPDFEPRAGFYARVMERIEAQGAASIWNLFFDSPVGRGLAMASMVVALSLGLYLVSAESSSHPVSRPRVTVLQGSDGLLTTGSLDSNAVLVNLITYREQ